MTTKNWYHHRHELRCGQIFRTHEGGYVQLDQGVPGDGTRWRVFDWSEGYSSPTAGSAPGGWTDNDSTVEPGDLAELIPDAAFKAIARESLP